MISNRSGYQSTTEYRRTTTHLLLICVERMNRHTFCGSSAWIEDLKICGAGHHWMIRSRYIRVHQSFFHFVSICRFVFHDNTISPILEDSIAIDVANAHDDQNTVTFRFRDERWPHQLQR